MAFIELRAAAQQALEACKLIVSAFDALKPASAARNEPLQINAARASITALEAALAEPVQEPAFHGFMSADGTRVDLCFTPGAPRADGTYATAYYTAPPPAQPVQEPVQEGCYHCKHFAAVKCKVCGRTT